MDILSNNLRSFLLRLILDIKILQDEEVGFVVQSEEGRGRREGEDAKRSV